MPVEINALQEWTVGDRMLDDMDVKILSILQQDCTRPVAEIEAVERYLQAGGFTGTLNLIPKGKSEPFMGIDRTKYAGEALYQLDRRVELRLFR